MQITKEQMFEFIKCMKERLTINSNEIIVHELKRIVPEAFEPEVKECFLWDDEEALKAHIVDTGNWRIFEGGDSFYVVNKNHHDLPIEFLKKGNWNDYYLRKKEIK